MQILSDKIHIYIGFEVLRELTVKILVLWHVTTWNWVAVFEFEEYHLLGYNAV
jgi:hypothetical protein